MKKTAIFVLIICVLQLISVSLWSANQPNAKPFSIESKSSSSMDIQFKIPVYEIEKEVEGGKIWDRIKIDDCAYLIETGKPELPIINTTIAIPNHGQVNIEIINAQTKLIKHIIPYPAQDGTSEGTPKGFSLNQAFYQSNDVYPQDVIKFSDPQILRDFRIITVQIQPFAWNSATQELEVREQVDFRLNFNNAPGINELDGPLVISPSFANIYESMILNFDDYRGAMIANTPPRLLVIYGAYTDATFQTKLNEFVFWKKQKGADVRLISTSVTGNTTTAIKNYIQSVYDDVNSRPDFIVLIGDTSGSFSIPTFTENFSSYSGVGDYPYQHLAGNDYVGDVFLGRISAENTSQLDNLFAKIYFYEKNINVNTASWLNKMLLVGDTAPSGQSTVYLNKYIKYLSLVHNPDYTFTELYSGDPSPDQMNQAINSGVGFFNYRGYISMSGWSPSASLVNGVKLPHATILTCSTGSFNGLATTESFIRLGTPSVPAGAVTAIGMATSGTHTMFNNALNVGMYNGIFTHKMRTMGEALLNGKLILHESYNQLHSNTVKYFSHWCNLMGDPTMEVFIKVPNTFISNAPTSLPMGTSNLGLNITDQTSVPVQGACVTISQNNIILARGYTDDGGNTYLFFNVALSSGSAVVTVSKHDFKPLQRAITISGDGSLVAGLIMIDDDNVGSSVGNGNFSANSGETLEVLFSVRNTTLTAINNVVGTVSCNSPYVTLINNTVNFANVDPGVSNYSLSPILFSISHGCPNNAVIKFDIQLTDAADSTYLIPNYIVVTDAFMHILGYQVTDTNNSALDPGETVTLNITVKNNGTVPINDLYGQLITQNDLVQITDNAGWFGNLLVGTQASSVVDPFELHGRAQLLPGTVIPMKLKLYTTAGFLQWIDFSFTVGVVTQNDPLGPDAYGYVIYDVTDTSYEECPAYNWIGIAPAEGGTGTALALTDTGSSSDEGDAVGAASMVVVDLPFPFIFYGQTYSQISVTSNGFIVMGVSENANYRNMRLPGVATGSAGAPSPVIAPFWDDLSTSGGGVYKWYDSINHLFIIEWYNCKNGFVQSAVETFQVILYDPVYYPTSMGDGPIKIQYHTFNNVDTGNASLNEYNGNYCTIGLQNADQTIGLEYSFNNTYPTAAAPITHQKALFITTAPVYHFTPHLLYESAYILDNNNNVLEPNESVDLFVNLMNIGEQSAQNVSTNISSVSPYVTINVSNASYAPIAGGEAIGVNQTPFRISVSADCPDKQIIPFVMTITTDSNMWQRTFNLTVEKSSMMYHSFLIVDAQGNNNGVADPGESIILAVHAKNKSLVNAYTLSGMLTTTNPNITISDPIQLREMLEPDDIMQFAYQVNLGAGIVPGTSLTFNFNLISANAPTVNSDFNFICGTSGSILDFESSHHGFNSNSGWQLGQTTLTTPHSGSNLWATNLTGQYPNNAMMVLYSPQITLGANSMLSFWHMMSCQNYYDGGNVSISANNGDTWQLLYPVGGYNTSLNVYSLGEVGYTNSVSWNQANFDLNQFTGQTVILRWRFGSNASVQGTGWFIDDIMLSGIFVTPGSISGNVSVNSDVNPSYVKLASNDKIVTNPSTTGDYAMYLPQGEYNLKASLPYHTSQTSPGFILNNTQTTFTHNFSLYYLPAPTGLAYSGAHQDTLVFLTWIEPMETDYTVLSYKVFRRYMDHPYRLAGETTLTSFNEVLADSGSYYYYVQAVYAEGIGDMSNIIDVAFPFVSEHTNTTPILVNALHQNYPNPFNPTTTFAYSLAKSGKATLRIYNTKGQLVKTMVDSPKSAGLHKIIWDGVNNEGRQVSSGIYFYRLDVPGYTKTKKMMLLK